MKTMPFQVTALGLFCNLSLFLRTRVFLDKALLAEVVRVPAASELRPGSFLRGCDPRGGS